MQTERRDAGMSLIEVLVALAVTGIVLAVVVTFVSGTTRMASSVDAREAGLQDAKVLTRRLQNEVNQTRRQNGRFLLEIGRSCGTAPCLLISGRTTSAKQWRLEQTCRKAPAESAKLLDRIKAKARCKPVACAEGELPQLLLIGANGSKLGLPAQGAKARTQPGAAVGCLEDQGDDWILRVTIFSGGGDAEVTKDIILPKARRSSIEYLP